MKETAGKKRILLIRLSSLGDVLLTDPVVAAVHERYPDASIDFLVRKEFAELIRHNPSIDHILTFDRSSGFRGLLELRRHVINSGYSAIVDLHGSTRSKIICFASGIPYGRIKKNQFIRFLLIHLRWNLYRKKGIVRVPDKYVNAAKFLGVSGIHRDPIFHISDEAIGKGEDLWDELKNEGFGVVMAPGARHFTKRWPEEYYAGLINLIHENYGVKTILLGGPDEIETIHRIESMTGDNRCRGLAGKITLMESAGLIRCAPFFVSNDSFLMHVAAAFGVWQAAIFGSTSEELGFFPNNPHAKIFEEKDLSCRPCTHIGRSSCPKKHFHCMMRVKPQDILRFYEEVSQV